MSETPVTLVWPAAALLGEGPVWDARRHCLWFVDIKRGCVHRYDPGTDRRTTIAVGGMPCFILPADDGGYVLGNGDALLGFDGERATRVMARVAMPANNRFNDGTVDDRGRIWFGSMDNEEASDSGVVYVHDAGAIRVAGGRCPITNGPAIGGGGRWLYHVDTVGGVIWRFDISGTAELRDGEIFVRIAPRDGHPDGVAIDSENHLWVGLWGGWAARRYSPDGRLVQEVRFPVANVTKIALGGPDLRTAFATTARQGLNDDALADQPLAGALFSFRVEVAGIPMPDARV